MPDELEDLLRLVAAGELSPEEAAPLVAELQRERRQGAGSPGGRRDRPRGPSAREALSGRRLRLRVAEHGHQVVNLQIPLAAAGAAIDNVPGLSPEMRVRVVEAIRSGMTGPILEVDDDGDEVRIVIE